MTKKTLVLSLATIAVLSLSALAIAGNGYGPGGCPGWGGNNAQQQPALTPEQQEKAQTIYEEFEKATIPLREQLFSKHALLEAALDAEKPDTKTVDGLTKELGELKTKLFTERVELRKKLDAAGLPDSFGPGMGMGSGMGRGMMAPGNGPCGSGAPCPGASAPCSGNRPCNGGAPCPGYGG